ncbi:Ribonuclease H-like protein [Macrophomina phaseolina MS6]|uniref:Ribonuclease H-like protein n=1 Tax=Macrophomina phaseolina (strain MS6) TaxID=1126212 RepID=K2S100_MACPH|nr:Ribonuclease H-like protein [Macrophomina phaseolina MS6]
MLLNARSRINISTDTWTGPNSRSYCGIVAHFIDQTISLRTLLIGLPRILGQHTGENIASCLLNCFREYEITERIGCFVTDNASNNDKAIDIIVRVGALPGVTNAQRIRCIGHVINLVVKALLFGKGLGKLEEELRRAGDEEMFDIWSKQGPIGRLHNICVYINRSDTRRQEFMAGQANAHLLDDDPDVVGDPIFYYQLKTDGGVRWNAVYCMIKRGKLYIRQRLSIALTGDTSGLRLRQSIDLYFLRWHPRSGNDYNLKKDALDAEDWRQLELYLALLRPFKSLTKRMEGMADKDGREGSHSALWEILKSMDYMHSHLIAASKRINSDLEYFKEPYTAGVNAATFKLNEYYDLTDKTPLYRAAIILHPSIKLEYFREYWKEPT